MEKVKLAVIGAGGLAQSQHIPNILRSQNAILKTVCDLRMSVLQKVKQKFGISSVVTNHKSVLQDPQIQGVVIATQAEMHVPLTIEALEAGKHVYVEKPLAETEEECQEVLKVQNKAGKLVLVGMNRRLAPAYQYAKDILWRHGGPRNMYYRISDAYCLTWGKDFPPDTRVIHECCHIFDILRFFANSEVTSIYSLKARKDDEAFAMQFQSGSIASLLSSGYTTSDMPKERFEAIAEAGGITIEEFVELRSFGFKDCDPVVRFGGHFHPDGDQSHVFFYQEIGAEALYVMRRTIHQQTERHRELQEKGEIDTHEFKELDFYIRNKMPLGNYHVDKGWMAAIDHFAECIATGKEPKTTTAKDALQVTRIVNAAIKSRKTGVPVHLQYE